MKEATFTERMEQFRRNEVVALQSLEILAQWDRLKVSEEAMSAARMNVAHERQKYTDMLAAARKVTIGMHVSVTKRHGYKQDSPLRTTVYEVTSYTLYGSTNLLLRGRTIRKDDSIGEIHDIGTGWKVVA